MAFADGTSVENLCENAVEHNDDPSVSVSVETVTDDRQWIRIAVADDGTGIPKHERTVLTEGEETDLEHGSGLGLWLVNWVVERSGGRLTFADDETDGAVVSIDRRQADDTVGSHFRRASGPIVLAGLPATPPVTRGLRL
jgi:nitrogen fixation/metabolism regulation signal transduction histidine kinase